MYVSSHDGARIHFRLEGDAEAQPLLLSNSLGTRLEMWDWQISELARHFRVIRYDSRGHGRSDAPDGPYTIEALARDALAVMDAAGVRRAHILGLSKGGMVGMWLGANAGEVVDRLILANTSAYMPPRELWDQRIDAVLNQGMEAVEQTILDRWFTPGFLQSNRQDVDKVREMIRATPAHGYAGCCAAIRDMDQRQSIRNIGAPTMIIAGEKDPSTPVAMAQEMVAAIPGSRLVIFDNTAHLSNVERAEDFTTAVLSFLGVGL